MGQIQPAIHFYNAHELRLVFTYLNGWKKKKKEEYYFITQDNDMNSNPSAHEHSFLGTRPPHPLIKALPVVVFGGTTRKAGNGKSRAGKVANTFWPVSGKG